MKNINSCLFALIVSLILLFLTAPGNAQVLVKEYPVVAGLQSKNLGLSFSKSAKQLTVWDSRQRQIWAYHLPTGEKVADFGLSTYDIRGVYYSQLMNKYYITDEQIGKSAYLRIVDGTTLKQVQVITWSDPLFIFAPYVDGVNQKVIIPFSRGNTSGGPYSFLVIDINSKEIVDEIIGNGYLSGIYGFNEQVSLFFHVADSTPQNVIHIYDLKSLSEKATFPTDQFFYIAANPSNSIDFKYLQIEGEFYNHEHGGKYIARASSIGLFRASVIPDRHIGIIFVPKNDYTGREAEFQVINLQTGQQIGSFQITSIDASPRLLISIQDQLYAIYNSSIKVIDLADYLDELAQKQVANSLTFPFVRQDDSTWTGLALSSQTGAGVSLTARDERGDLIASTSPAGEQGASVSNPARLQLNQNQQIARFPQELFGNEVISQIDNVTAEFSKNADLTGFYMVGDHKLELYLDGAVAINRDEAGKVIFAPHGAEEIGDLVVMHLGEERAAFTATLINEFGDVIDGPRTVDKEPLESTFFLTEPTSRGYYRIESQEPLVGLTIQGSHDISFYQGLYMEDASRTLNFEHVALSPGWASTHLVIINPSAQPQTVTLRFHKDDGTVLQQISLTIGPQQMIWDQVAELFSITSGTGYVVGEVTTGPGLLGWVNFRIGLAETALPMQVPRSSMVLNHIAQVKPTPTLPGWNHGVTIRNTENTRMIIDVAAFHPNGELITWNYFELQPGEKLARHLFEPEFFGPEFEQAGGWIKIWSPYPDQKFTAFSLFYQTYHNGSPMRLLSAIPGQ